MDIKEILRISHHEIVLLYQEIRRKKSFDLKVPFSNDFKYLVDQGILVQSEQDLTINYSFPTCIILSSVILDDESFNLLADLDSIDLYAEGVIKEANQNGITSRISQFRNHLIKELIIHCFQSGIDLCSQILALEKASMSVFSLADPITMAIPLLPLSLDRSYALHSHLYAQVYDDGSHQQIFKSLQDLAGKFGSDFLSIANQNNNNRVHGYVMNILLGLYSMNKQLAWIEIKSIDQKTYEIEIIKTMSNFQLDSEYDVSCVVDHLKTFQPNDSNSSSLIWVFSHVINSPYSNQETKSFHINLLKTIAYSQGERAQGSLIQIMDRLDVDDIEKYDLIKALNFKNANLHRSLGWLIHKFSPALCFGILRMIAIACKLNFKTELFQHSLRSLYTREPIQFGNELTKILVDDIGMVRFGGNKILQEINNKHQPFAFSEDILKLDENLQIRFMDAILLDFLHPEDVIKFILPFRNSSYPFVLQSLVNYLAIICEDYSSDTIRVLKEELDPKEKTDKQVLDIFEKYSAELSNIITKKNELEEFSPNNSAREFAYFERLVRDKMREQLNKSESENSILSIAHKVSIARGKSWKIEKNDSEPSQLSLISTSLTYPRTCLMNPDEYNWDFLVRVNTDYKKSG